MSAALSRAAFHAEGLRWIAALLLAAADRLDRRTPAAARFEPLPARTPHDEALHELRNRLSNTW